MKKTLIAATLAAGLSTPALADGPGPIMHEDVIVTETAASSTSASTVVLLAALVVFAAAASMSAN